jgi:hypothetical protein
LWKSEAGSVAAGRGVSSLAAEPSLLASVRVREKETRLAASLPEGSNLRIG